MIYVNVVGVIFGVILITGLSVFAVWNIVCIVIDLKKKHKRKKNQEVVTTIEGKEVDTKRED